MNDSDPSSDDLPNDGLPPADDPLWDEVVAGQLDEQAQAELRALATSEADELRLAAFAPLDDAFQDRITARLQDELSSQTAEPTAGAPRQNRQPTDETKEEESELDRETAANDERELGNVTDGPGSWWRAVAIASGLAIAAAVLLVIVPFDAPLPVYEGELRGGAATHRAEPSNSHHFVASNRIEIVFRPRDPTRVVPQLSAFTSATSDAPLVPWALPAESIEFDENGAVRIAGEIGTLLPDASGALVLWIFVHDASIDRGSAEARLGSAREEADDDLRLHRFDIFVDPS